MSKVFKLVSSRALLKATLFCLSFLFFQLFIYSQEDTLDGAKIFKTNCAACHSVGSNKIVGPGLEGIEKRHSREWLGKWISNSGEFIASGDPDAQAIFAENNNIPMPPQAVSPEDIDAILAYIKSPKTSNTPVIDNTGIDKATAEDNVDDSIIGYFLGVIALLLLILVVTLVKIKIFTKEILAK